MKTVLVLEDDPVNIKALSTILGMAGYKVVETITGLAALEAGRRCLAPPDLFLSDVAVPDCSGPAAALELSRIYPAMRTLFVSGTPLNDWKESDLQKVRQISPDRVDFLEKPFRASLLLEKVGKLLQKYAPAISTRLWPGFRREDLSRGK
jgi:CheY-like chemotaxis protein